MENIFIFANHWGMGEGDNLTEFLGYQNECPTAFVPVFCALNLESAIVNIDFLSFYRSINKYQSSIEMDSSLSLLSLSICSLFSLECT